MARSYLQRLALASVTEQSLELKSDKIKRDHIHVDILVAGFFEDQAGRGALSGDNLINTHENHHSSVAFAVFCSAGVSGAVGAPP